LDDKVKNPTDGMTGEVIGNDGKPVEGAKVEIDKNSGEIAVTVPEGTKAQDATVVVKDKDDSKVGEVDIKITEPGKDDTGKPGIDAGSVVDEVPANDKPKDLDDKVKNPTDGMTGEVIGNDGKPVEGAKVEIDKNTGEIAVTVPEGTKAQDATVVVKDKEDNKVGEVDIKITEPGKDDTGKPDDSSDWDGSSNLSPRCINTGLGVGIPLLFLIPVGLASQMNIPGLKDFVAPINKQIQNLNTQLQKQAGVFNGPLAGKVAGIDAQLKRFGAEYQQVAGAVALIAAGALAIGLIADACAPGAGSSNGSSK
ncbi:hypothetical protein ACGLFO_04510, partial [Corynebacterium hesseae]|uniref:hypothetical protein n=1 Tax=Corynebacterium hesseae TaxID=2913502 RepID=UPI00373E0E4C